MGTGGTMRTKFRSAILKFAQAMEIVMAVIILAAIVLGAVLLVAGLAEDMRGGLAAFSVTDFLSKALMIIMGVEFIKMLMLHTYGAVTDVLLFAVARQMILNHDGPAVLLLNVAALAGIFAIKRYLCQEE